MNGSRNQRALVLELMMAVLFFALCACVLLRLFTSGGEISRRAGEEGQAVLYAQTIAERLCAEPEREAAEAYLQGEAFCATEDGAWLLSIEGMDIRAELAWTQMPAGTLMEGRVIALADGRNPMRIELPAVRYVPLQGKAGDAE